jgi:hypothetical protein
MRKALFLFAGAILLNPAFANASCVQGDLTGKWQVYGLSVFDNGAGWIRCLFTVSSSGAIANTACTQSDGQSKNLRNGKVTLTNGATCTFTARFTLNGDLNKLLHATIAPDKQTAAGVGEAQPSGIWMTSMVKR